MKSESEILKVAIIVPTCNRARDVTRLLENIYFKQVIPPHLFIRVFVIDNGPSTDSLVLSEKFQDFIHKGLLEVYHFKRKLGATFPLKIGMKISLKRFDPDVLMLVDSDAYPVSNNLVLSLVEHIIADKSIGAVMPVNLLILEDIHAFSQSGAAFHFFTLSKSAVDKCGFPDVDFFIYKDDIEYRQRIESKGLRCKVLRNAFYLHPTTSLNIAGVFTYGPRNSIRIAKNRGRTYCLKELVSHILLGAVYSMFFGFKNIFALLIQGFRCLNTKGEIKANVPEVVSEELDRRIRLIKTLDLSQLPKGYLFIATNPYVHWLLRKKGFSSMLVGRKGTAWRLLNLLRLSLASSKSGKVVVTNSFGLLLLITLLSNTSFCILPTHEAGDIRGKLIRINSRDKIHMFTRLALSLLAILPFLIVSLILMRYSNEG